MEFRSETQPKPLSPSPQFSRPSVTSCESVHPENAARINNLPTELLIHILLLSLVRSYEAVAHDSLFGNDFVLSQLRSVCTRWNDTILGEPTFWTHIDIRTGSRTVEVKLLRSGALPLTVQYSNWEEEAYSGEEHPEYLRSIELISQHTHRWKSISFWALDWELDQLTDHLERSPHPELEYLKIRRGSASEDRLEWWCGEATSPQRVLFDGRALPWNSSEFGSLVEIEIEGAVGYLDSLVDLTRASQNLEVLRLTYIEFDDHAVAEQREIGWPDESRPSVLPKLVDIQIFGFQSPDAIACVLRCIRVPNIRTLNLVEGRVIDTQQGSQIIRAITTYHGSQSILNSMLHDISSRTTVELWCFQETMRLDLENSVTHKNCRLELSLTRADWEESAAMIGDMLRVANVAIYLRFERLPPGVVPVALLLFPGVIELEFASSDISCKDILLTLRVLKYSVDIGGGVKTWICPRLAKIRLPGGWSEAEAIAIADSATSLKHARRNFNDQNTRDDDGDDTYDVWDEVRVLVGESEI